MGPICIWSAGKRRICVGVDTGAIYVEEEASPEHGPVSDTGYRNMGAVTDVANLLRLGVPR